MWISRFFIVCECTQLWRYHRNTSGTLYSIPGAKIFSRIKYKFISFGAAVGADCLHHLTIRVQVIGAQDLLTLAGNIASAIIMIHPGDASILRFVLWGCIVHDCFLVFDICVVNKVYIVWSYLLIVELSGNHSDLPPPQDIQARDEIGTRLCTLEASLIDLLQPWQALFNMIIQGVLLSICLKLIVEIHLDQFGHVTVNLALTPQIVL